MTNIPPNMNIMGSILQSQTASKDVTKKENARRSQEAQESRQIRRLSEQHQEEVENTEQTDEVVIRRQDDREQDGRETQDEYRRHEENISSKLYSPTTESPPSSENPHQSEEDTPPGTHIDLSI